MVIDINSINPAQPGKPRNGGAGNVAADKSTTNTAANPASANANDSIEISAAAQDLSRIQKALQNLPQVDEARVNQISEQIANGEYNIDASSLADKILASDKSFDS